MAARLHVVNSLIANNGIASTKAGAGILIQPSGAGYANFTLEIVQAIGNGDAVSAAAGTPGARVTLVRSIVTGDFLNSLFATGPAAQILISNTAIAGNSNGATISGGTIASYGTNELVGNGPNGAFSGVITQY